MALNKLYIDFDPATPTVDDRIGAFQIGAGGDVITSTTDGGREALDVNDSLSLAMLTTIEGDLDTANASLGAINSDTTAILADTATIDSNLASLVKAEDAPAGNGYNGIPVFAVRNDAGTSLVSADGDFASLQLNAVGQLRTSSGLDLSALVSDDAVASEKALPIAVTAVSTSSALGAVSAAGDKADLRSDLNRRLLTNTSYGVGWLVVNGTIGTTPTQLNASPLPGCREIGVHNKSSKSMWMKNDNTAGVDSGVEIPKLSQISYPWTGAMPVWIVGVEAGQKYEFVQMG